MKILRHGFGRITRILCVVTFMLMAACDGEPLLFAPVAAPSTLPLNDNSDPVPETGNALAGDGFENNRPDAPVAESLGFNPDVLSLPGNAASITELVLVTGQSNALGADTAFDPILDAPHPRAYAFTEEGWRIADLHQVWDLGWHPRNHPDTDPSNNFGFHFVRTVAERRADRVIGFILVTFPGAGIEEWDYESEFYLTIRDRVAAALNELPSKATIDGILWHQGETDWEDTDLYAEKLNNLIQNFRGESWFGEQRPFICGETAIAPVNRRLKALNIDGDPWTGCVEGEGLPTVNDDSHFSAEGLRTIGARYATKYIRMTEQP